MTSRPYLRVGYNYQTDGSLTVFTIKDAATHTITQTGTDFTPAHTGSSLQSLRVTYTHTLKWLTLSELTYLELPVST